MPMIVGAHTADEVQLALEWASDSIESYCERKFAFVQSDTVFVDPQRGNGGRQQAMLPNPPVSNVSQVLAQLSIGGGLAWSELQYYSWAGDGLIYDTARYYGYFGVTGSSFWSGVNNADGFFDYGIPSWPTLPRSLQVTYDHGFILPGTSNANPNVPTLPQGIVSAVIRGAALYLENPQGATEVGIGEVRYRFADPTTASGNSGFLGGWMDTVLLGEYRLVHL